jgi:hypothetical protein
VAHQYEQSGAHAPRFFWSLILAVLFIAPASRGADFGGVGLLDLPSARMRPDGMITLGTSQQGAEDIYSVTYQAFPWLEGTFRYLLVDPNSTQGTTDDFRLRDRSFEAKALLLREAGLRPAIAVGFRDLLGTGVQSSEYLVASKSFGPLDLTLGLGWGRLAGRNRIPNPVGELFDAGKIRAASSGEGGKPRPQDFFRGENVGLFGGFELTLPRDTRFIAEYTTDRYERAVSFGTLRNPSPWNYGIGWRPAPGIDLVASHQLGADFALAISATLDTKSEAPRKASPAFWSVDEPPERWDASEDFRPDSWYARLLFDVERSGLLMLSGDLRDRGRSAWLELENGSYQYEADAIRRVLTLAELHLPKSVRTVHVILQSDGIAQSHVRYQRRVGARSSASAFAVTDEASLISVLPPRAMVAAPDYATAYRKPMFNFGVNIGQRMMIMDPDDPLRYQVLARINLGADLGRDWYLRSSVALNIYNDWDTISRTSDSVLPRVRSEIRQYLQKGNTGIDALYLEKRGMVASDLVYRAYGGILEEMFAGVGGEVLYRPYPSRFAFGLNLNYVWQRDYEKRFSMQDYKVLTGHGSVYWASPFSNYDAAVHVGRYLAKDVGATFEVRRTFENGWMVGGFFTLTDVPFEEFGEGSFDKGLFFRVPFNSLLPGNTRGAYQTIIRTIQRDGGARLEGIGDTLWWEGRGHRPDALTATRARMVPQ